MTLVIVYVGAVAVLFLFVVMMLNINVAELRQGFLRYLPIGLLMAAVLSAEMGALLYAALKNPQTLLMAANPIPSAELMNNTRAIGNILYTKYIYLFQLAGVVLLVAMIGAIVLTLRARPGVRRQDVLLQQMRTRTESIYLVDIKPGQGA